MWLPLTHPLLGTWPATQARALTWNQNIKHLVRGPALNPLSHTSQGWLLHFKDKETCLLSGVDIVSVPDADGIAPTHVPMNDVSLV